MDNDTDLLDVAQHHVKFPDGVQTAIALTLIDIAKSLRKLSTCTYQGAILTQPRGH